MIDQEWKASLARNIYHLFCYDCVGVRCSDISSPFVWCKDGTLEPHTYKKAKCCLYAGFFQCYTIHVGECILEELLVQDFWLKKLGNMVTHIFSIELRN